MRAYVRNLLTFMVFLGICGSVSATGPTPDERAIAGTAAMAKKKFADAVTQFLLAYVADPRPDRLILLARAYDASKNKDATVALYSHVLATSAGTPAAAEAQSRLVALGALTVETPASLLLTVIPMGAAVTLDGAPIGMAPLPLISLAPGSHTLGLNLDGFQPVTQTLSATSGQSLSIVVTLVPAASAAPPVPTHVPPPASSGPGLAGTWIGTRYSNDGRRDSQTVLLTLNGAGTNVTGDATVTTSLALPAHKKAQCNAADLVTTTRFTARYTGDAAGGTIITENGTVAACSCEGLCSAASGSSYGVRQSPRGGVMSGADFYFQRYDGPPPSLLSRPLDAGQLNGRWTMHVFGVSNTGSVTLGGSGGRLEGSLAMTRSAKVQSFRKAECKGADEVVALHHYSIEGEPRDASIDMSFSYEKYENCSCAEGACASAAGAVGISDEFSFWTLDGNHIVSPKYLLVRE